ncbi:MAG: methylmalonyl-CoA mutase, partial [Rhodothermales bacterium]|nr:methylmalonyl-CoA mutase [Rhodothermales bacterium]
SLHTNSFDEAIALPTDFSARIARNTQLILQHETGLTDLVDPLGGSYMIEKLTEDLRTRALSHIEEVEEMGGMARAIAEGLPKMRIEQSAARRQARIDSGEEVIVGVNRFRVSRGTAVDVREIDNTAVRDAQIRRLESVRAARDDAQVQRALDAVTDAAGSESGELLEACVDAALARATLGEISDALEEVFGRYEARTESIGGVYASAYVNGTTMQDIIQLSDRVAAREGRRPRILVVKLGQDGHDRGARVIATAFADLGFDVDIGPLFQTPREAARQAVENDVHVVGVSSLAGGHATLIPELIDALGTEGRSDIQVVAGGVIPEQHHETLRRAGVSFIFGPGTAVPDAARTILESLLTRDAQPGTDGSGSPTNVESDPPRA